MRAVFLLCLSCCCGLGAAAQSDSAQTGKKKTTVTTGVTYASNASYYGQLPEEAMPYVALSASVRIPAGFYITGLGYRLLKDSGRIVSAMAAGAGFAFPISKKLEADLSYTHTFYPANSPFLQASSPDNASLALTHTGWLTTGLRGDYNFGDEQDVFASLSLEKQINLGSLAKGKDLITLTPSAEVTAGTQHFYETYTTQKRYRDSLLGLPLPVPVPIGETETRTRSVTNFNLLSYNFKVPLAYNRTHYMIEAAYQLSVLSEWAATGAGTANSIFNLSFYYQF
ncbi:hypothetical protein ACWKWU_00410 [Chitinophaga lutea]